MKKKKYVLKTWVVAAIFYTVEILGLIAIYLRNN